MQNIIELGRKHKTQKAEPRWEYMLHAYQKHLPKSCKTLLEIGCLKGGSARMFRDYLGAQVHLLDLFHPDYSIHQEDAEREGFTTYKGSQNDLDLLATLPKFDIIVEDGSHHSDDQIITFKYLFEHKLNKGGLYVIEDLHCCNEPYWWCSIKRFEDTFLHLLKTGKFESQLFTKEEEIKFNGLIKKYTLENDSIAFIWKL